MYFKSNITRPWYNVLNVRPTGKCGIKEELVDYGIKMCFVKGKTDSFFFISLFCCCWDFKGY